MAGSGKERQIDLVKGQQQTPACEKNQLPKHKLQGQGQRRTLIYWNNMDKEQMNPTQGTERPASLDKGDLGVGRTGRTEGERDQFTHSWYHVHFYQKR